MFINVNADLVRLAMITASKEQTRFYLNGVCLQPGLQGGVILVSTDGHRLTCLWDNEGEMTGAESVIFPARGDSDMILKACKSGKNEARRLVIDGDEYRPTVSVCHGHESDDRGLKLREIISASVQMIDGSFPDWRRVVPHMPHAGGQLGEYDAKYIADFAKIAAELGGARSNPMTISATDTISPALVTFGLANAFGVIMPLRNSGAKSDCVPDWVRSATAFAAVA